jgi:hypothetical protein
MRNHIHLKHLNVQVFSTLINNVVCALKVVYVSSSK